MTTESTSKNTIICQGFTDGRPCRQPLIPVNGSTVHPTCTERAAAWVPLMPEGIKARVHNALVAAGGDIEAAAVALGKRAIMDGMALFTASRTTARYEHTSFPDLPEILQKRVQGRGDAIWEGRHHWTNRAVENGTTVTQLDVNAAYLSALNTRLPVGRLVHQEHEAREGRQEWDGKRAGVYLISPPEWQEHPELPNPLGNRKEAGKLWVSSPTLQLLWELALVGQCDHPVIHESWTSHGSESLMKKFREILRDARAAAVATDDDLTYEYVKAIYSKVISTMGESANNRDIRRPDWMHIIRAQAFANLWRRAARATAGGLRVYRATGTDELHVVGDWRAVFKEGRHLAEMKAKGEYVVGAPRGE